MNNKEKFLSCLKTIATEAQTMALIARNTMGCKEWEYCKTCGKECDFRLHIREEVICFNEFQWRCEDMLKDKEIEYGCYFDDEEAEQSS